MEQKSGSSITKWLLLGLAVVLFIQYGWPAISGKGADEKPPEITDLTRPNAARAAELTCVLEGKDTRAELSSRGASLKSFVLTDARFRSLKSGAPMDLVAPEIVIDHSPSWQFWKKLETVERRDVSEHRRPLRTNLRAPGDAAGQQVPVDDVDWVVAPSDDKKSCVFTYQDEAKTTLVTKTVALTDKPFELAMTVEVKNLAAEPKRHRLSAESGVWLKPKDVEGGLGRQSEHLTEVVAATKSKVERFGPSDFSPSDFKKKEFTTEAWRRSPGDGRFVAVSNVFFTRMLMPKEGPAAPYAETRVEEWWDTSRTPVSRRTTDPDFGHVYRARLAYPEQTLKPNESATYTLTAFVGPKDRVLLKGIGAGSTDVLNLGMFRPIVDVLVWYLYKIYGILGSWGLSIIVLTITVRLLVFPLSISQIKNSAKMRELKPELDALNEKYKDDMTQRGLATQELLRKNGVHHVLGCLPMLLTLPVWWALYSALQNEAALYHTPFGPKGGVIPDLSAPGKYFIIPIALGASSFIQQKIMPPQGDPAQQRMMLYMMPAVFTFMMLFLPSGLGVYMLTSSLLAILQQVLVERWMKTRSGPGAGRIVVEEKPTGSGGKSAPALGKGKARVRG